jgi:Tfp pilus assembly protein FimT
MVLVVLSIIFGLSVPRIQGLIDQIATDRASSEVVMFYQRARLAAVWRATAVEMTLGEDSLRATFRGMRDSVFLRVPGPAQHGVSMTVSRNIIRVYASGLGWGAANTKLVFRRGEAAESLTTSRLGRIKRW